MTNKATLWYVPLSLKNVNKVLEVPPIQVGAGFAPRTLELTLSRGTALTWPHCTPVCAGGFADPIRTPLPFQYARKEQEDEGKKRYEEQKLDRLETKQRNDLILPIINPGNTGSARPVEMSQQRWEAKLVAEATPAIPGHRWLRERL